MQISVHYGGCAHACLVQQANSTTSQSYTNFTQCITATGEETEALLHNSTTFLLSIMPK